MTFKPLFSAVLLLAITGVGCTSVSSTYDATGQRKSMTINGNTHYFDNEDRLVMSREQYKSYIASGAVQPPVQIDNNRGMKVSPEELAVLMQDRAAFYNKMDGKSETPDEVSVLVSKGSLRGNLMRIANELGYTSVEWSIPTEYSIPEPYAVTGLHRRAVIVNIIGDFPIKVIAEEDKNRLVFSPQSVGYTP